MMPSCCKAARLLSESMERKLSLWERMLLKFHLAMCRMCRGFSAELVQLREAARRHAMQLEEGTADAEVTLSAEARLRIQKALQSQDG